MFSDLLFLEKIIQNVITLLLSKSTVLIKISYIYTITVNHMYENFKKMCTTFSSSIRWLTGI